MWRLEGREELLKVPYVDVDVGGILFCQEHDRGEGEENKFVMVFFLAPTQLDP